jgi:NADH-quinone oxidoreductase subunit C
VSHPDVLAAALQARFGSKLISVASLPNELCYEVASAEWLGVAAQLRDASDCKFEQCVDVCGIDYLEYGRDEWKTASATATGFSRGVIADARQGAPAPGRRFAAVYHLLSVSLNHRVRIRVFCPDDAQPMLDSVTNVWASADWFEREAFDLFGILFKGHRDLRRILTDYGFIGHPFRKDFPLIGNVEVRYDPDKGRVVYEPVSIEPRTLVPKVIRRDNRYASALKDPKKHG